jgi:hypothetical protein
VSIDIICVNVVEETIPEVSCFCTAAAEEAAEEAAEGTAVVGTAHQNKRRTKEKTREDKRRQEDEVPSTTCGDPLLHKRTNANTARFQLHQMIKPLPPRCIIRCRPFLLLLHLLHSRTRIQDLK